MNDLQNFVPFFNAFLLYYPTACRVTVPSKMNTLTVRGRIFGLFVAGRHKVVLSLFPVRGLCVTVMSSRWSSV